MSGKLIDIIGKSMNKTSLEVLSVICSYDLINHSFNNSINNLITDQVICNSWNYLNKCLTLGLPLS